MLQGELADQSPGDTGRQQRVPGGDHADGIEESFGRDVLQQEATGTCAQRVVDVLVEIEGGQDEDRAVRPLPDPANCRVASMPSMPGMRTSISTTSGRRSRQMRTASAPSDAVPTTEKSGWVSSNPAKPSRTTWWSSATTMRTAVAAAVIRSSRLRARQRRPRRRSRRRALGRCSARRRLLRRVRACRSARARRPGHRRVRSGAVVTDAQPQRVGGVMQLHVDSGSRRVPAGIGQRLLGDAVCGELDAGIQRPRATRAGSGGCPFRQRRAPGRGGR